MILAGDIGGTNTRLVLIPEDGAPSDFVHHRRYLSAEHPSLEAIVRAFLQETGARPVAAAFGVAGPVLRGRSRPTNLRWHIDTDELVADLGIPRVRVVNDLEATGFGIPYVPAERQVVLNEGVVEPDGNGALLAAGTGLGESILVRRQSGGFLPIPSEGGHADFAPRDALQDALVAFLRPRFGSVSWERVLSGPGLVLIHEFLQSRPGPPERPDVLARFDDTSPAQVISEAALAGESPLTVAALRLFTALYGAAAANLALTGLATGGLWIGGGIAPKIQPALESDVFMTAFRAHAKMGALLARIPVRLLLEEQTALMGAARLAKELLAAGA